MIRAPDGLIGNWDTGEHFLCTVVLMPNWKSGPNRCCENEL